MIDLPIQTPGYGFPEDLVPNYESWSLDTGRTSNHDTAVLENPEGFRGEHLCIYMNASIKKQVAAVLPKLGTVKYLVIDSHVISQEVVDSLHEMSQLQRLHLAPIRSSDLGFLDTLHNLSHLSLEAAPNVRDLDPVLRHEKLVSLGLGTSVPDLDAIQPGCLPNLRCLILSGTGETKPARLPTLEPLANLASLEYICPLNCRIADRSLGFALQLHSLKRIHLHPSRGWRSEDVVALTEKGVAVSRYV